MLNNYRYFIVLAEEQNISRAADRLYISHQCLSKYLKNLEAEYGITFFNRKPFSLTYAGQLLLDSLRQIDLIDSNFQRQMQKLQGGQSGELRIGTTEGRLRLLMPDLMQEFMQQYPQVNLRMSSSKTSELLDMLSQNKLDFAIIGAPSAPNSALRYQTVLKEHLYLVISDNMLKEYFPDSYPDCKKTFQQGADLRLYQHVPFVLNFPNFSSRAMIDKHLLQIGASLTCVNEMTSMDLHHLMSARDYAASLALTMYLPGIWKLNHSSSDSKLNVFPIANLYDTHTIAVTCLKNKIFPEYAHGAMRIVRQLCQYYANIDL